MKLEDTMQGLIDRVVAAVSPAPPRPTITREVVRSVLTQDDAYRRRRHWPLLNDQDFAVQQMAHALPASANAVDSSGPPVDPELFFASAAYRRTRCVSSTTPVTSAAVGECMQQCFPELQKIFDAADGKLIAAGGAVAGAVVASSDPNNKRAARFGLPRDSDLDLFLVGVREEDVRPLLENVCRAAFAGDRVSFARNENAITVTPLHGRPYQFILRLYERPDLVLGGFDLATCACGYSPSLGLVMTPAAAFSLSTSTVLVDSARRSVSYEHRLFKYMNRGFRLLMASVVSPPPEDVVQVQRRWSTYAEPAGEPAETASDYGGDAHPCITAYGNIIRAASARHDQLSSATAVGETLEALLDRPSVPGAVGLDAMYRSRATRAYHIGPNVLSKYKRWFGEDAKDFVMAKMSNDAAAVDAIVQKTVTRIRQSLEAAAMQHRKPLKFITVDPGRQWTGSFNPIDEPPREFYGNNYRPTYMGLPSFEHVWLMKQVLRGLPKDLFRLIVTSYVIPAICRVTLIKAGFAVK